MRLALSDRTVNLLEDHVDLALRIGALPDSGLIATRLGKIRHMVCASPAYLAEHGAPRHPRDLATPMRQLRVLCSRRCVAFQGRWPRYRQSRSIRGWLVTTAEAAVDAAIAGAGVSCVLSYQAEPAVRDGQLELLLAPFEPAPLPVSLLYSGQGRSASEAARAAGFCGATTAGPLVGCRSHIRRSCAAGTPQPRQGIVSVVRSR